MQEQQIAAAAVHDQIARARRMKHTGDVVSASVLMQNLSTTLMQFD